MRVDGGLRGRVDGGRRGQVRRGGAPVVGGRADSGYVTAETAMVLPVLALLLAAALWSISVAGAQLRCVDAARDGARAAARGETDSAVVATADAAAPEGATVSVSHAGGRILVVVRARVGPKSGVLAAVPAPVAVATAVAESEAAP
ncbi:MAG: TadE family type IV pilus minor pilin [Acidothermaceae bacterium]